VTIHLCTPARLPLIALALAVLLPMTSGTVAGQPASPDTTPLEFHGFRAGARLGELQALVRTLAGGRLRCDQAKKDRRVIECRGAVNTRELGGPVDLWISSVDSVASIITLSTKLEPDQLERWRRAVERRYGTVNAKAQGSQWMMQWVRQRRMIRLTWRVERGGKVASLSLVDGHVLDRWAGRPAG
jgi:hypothetical protein